MPCRHIKVGDVHAIVCVGRGRKLNHKPCMCGSGKMQTRLCDWKMPGGTTCDHGMCESCTFQPARGKDLCAQHKEAYKEWAAKRRGPLI